MSRTIAVLLAVALVVSVGSHAGGDVQRVADPDDAHGPLDVRWVRHGHRVNNRGVGKLEHTVRLFEPWPVRRLRHRGFMHLSFDLRGNPDSPDERRLQIVYESGELVAEMYRSTEGGHSEFMQRVRMWRPTRRTIKVVFHKSLLRGRDFPSYKWTVLTFIDSMHSLCGQSAGCSDLGPILRHRL